MGISVAMLRLIKRFTKMIALCLCLLFTTQLTFAAARPFIVDTDMGVDDVLALLYFLKRPDIQVKAITIASDGSAHCKAALRNTLGLIKLLKQPTIPVACGRDTPLTGQHHFPSLVLKESDTLGGTAKLLPKVKIPVTPKAVDLIIKTLQQSTQPVTILAIGPLTNIAEALQKAPQIKSHIKAIYFMGGAINVPGNIPEVDNTIKNSVAEWNVYLDPLATDIVFKQKIPITLLPLDVTNKLPLDMDFYDLVQKNHHSPAADYLLALLENNKEWLQTKDWWYFWDPLLAVIASDESIAEFKIKRIRVLSRPEEQAGETVVDNEVKQKIRVVSKVNEDKFQDLFLRYLNKP